LYAFRPLSEVPTKWLTIGRLAVCGKLTAAAARKDAALALVARFGGIGRLASFAVLMPLCTAAFSVPFVGSFGSGFAPDGANDETPDFLIFACFVKFTIFPAGTAAGLVACEGDEVAAPTDAAATAASSSPARKMAAGANLRRFKIPLLSRSSTSPLFTPQSARCRLPACENITPLR
jgi:hypothetical protein